MLGSATEPDPLPAHLGRYEVLSELALGGMAQILLCKLRGPQGFERPVVVKRILPQLARDPDFVDMFVDEARVTVGIHHSNVVQVHELCQEGHELFLVMEYLSGETLLQLLRALATNGRRLPAAIAVHIVAEVCQGLRAAHELVGSDGRPRELVHRDIAPDNLFVTYDGEVKVLDFGIAHARGRATKTDAGSLKGKQGYMSPEQCLGLELDRRSDIFSLGVVLFELLSGQRLFKRDSAVAAAKAICDSPIRPPSSFRPGLPAELDTICARALERDRNRRYADCAALRNDLLAVARSLAPRSSPRDELRTMMHGEFRERMEKKARALREADERPSSPRTGPSAKPPAPVAVLEGPVTRSRIDADRTKPTAGVRAAWVIGLTVLLGLIGGGWFGWRRGRYAVAPVPERASPTTPTPLPEPPSPTVAPTPTRELPPTTIVLRVDSAPPGAIVHVDNEARGITPLQLTLARGDRPLSIRVEKAGFFSREERVVPSEDRWVTATLDPVPPPPPATSGKRAKSGSRGYYRWE